jgi:DNA-binding LacI/PurR family transcriptional regulator
VPFVTFGRPWGAPDTHAWVDVDNAAGTRAATVHLLAQGHRRIGFLGWPKGSGVGDARRAGWRAALDAAQRDGPDAAVIDGVESGAEAAAGLMSAPDPPTALVCASDSLALGALRVSREKAVIGFDDTAVAQAIGLTSVSQPLPEAAARCMDLLLELLDGRANETPARLLLAPSLVLRQTA